jgi:hypothetical protein
VESDADVARRQAAHILRTALCEDVGVSSTVRWCYYQHPAFVMTLPGVMVREWFGGQCDARVVRAFVARAGERSRSLGAEFPGREGEALIRALLGKMSMLVNLNPVRINYPETCTTLLDAEVIHDETIWYAYKAHESPLAFLDVSELTGRERTR